MRTVRALTGVAVVLATALAAPPASAADPEGVPWTGTTCEAAFTTRVTATVLLEDDVYTHPGLRVTDPLATHTGSYAQRQRKRANRIAKALPHGDGTAGSGEFTIRPGQVLGLLIPCDLTLSATRTPAGMLDRSLLYVSRVDGRRVWARDLHPVWVGGSDVVRRVRNTRGDALYEIK